MIQPAVRYYARFEYANTSGITPKYVVTQEAGYYEPMDKLKGKDGKVYVYLSEKLKDGARVPAMRLQAKNSLNLTGLKDYFVDGKISGYAYGNPPEGKEYSKDKKMNPFCEYSKDGFLFIVHLDNVMPGVSQKEIRPTEIEMIVLVGAKVLIAGYCKQLMMGGFDEALNQMREQAQNNNITL